MLRFPFLIVLLIASFLYARADRDGVCELLQVPLPDVVPEDSPKVVPPTPAVKKSSDSLDAPVVYHADEVTWMDVANKKVYLIGNAVVEYKGYYIGGRLHCFRLGKQ